MTSIEPHLQRRIATLALALVAATCIGLAALLGQQRREAFLVNQGAELGKHLQLSSQLLRQALDTLGTDALLLSRLPPIQGILRATRNGGFDARDGNSITTWKQRLTEIFSAFVEAHPGYYQVRYIGVADQGRELVRVNLDKGTAQSVAAERLQRTGDRDYYRATLRLRPGEVYLSEIDLNREHGVVELPHRPTVRAATPIYAPAGEPFGLVVINLDAAHLLARPTQGLPPGVRTYLTNDAGDFLVHPDPQRVFGFDLGRRYRLQQELPGLDAVPSHPGDDAPAPLQAIEASTGRLRGVAGRIPYDGREPGRFLLLAYLIPAEDLARALAPLLHELLAGTAGAGILTAVLILMGLHRLFSPLRHLTRAAHAIASGNYRAALPGFRVGEIGALTQAFDVMLVQVRQREQDLRRLQEELEERVRARTADLRLAASVVHNTMEGVMVTDADGVIIAVNPAFTAITGYSVAEALGQRPNMLRSHHHRPEFYQEMWRAVTNEGRWEGEIWNRRKDGDAYLEWLTISRIPSEEGTPLRYVGIFNDITELRRKDEHIRHLAYHDALTGLPNRMLLMDRLEHAIAVARREGHGVGLIFMDLDRFKAINDSLGHSVGDQLLQAVAGRLTAVLRGADTVARMGGDEFVLLTDPLTGSEACSLLVERILEGIGRPLEIAGHTLQVNASLGIALFPDDGGTATELMKHADAAMYAAKAAGRGTFRFFRPSMTE